MKPMSYIFITVLLFTTSRASFFITAPDSESVRDAVIQSVQEQENFRLKSGMFAKNHHICGCGKVVTIGFYALHAKKCKTWLDALYSMHVASRGVKIPGTICPAHLHCFPAK